MREETMGSRDIFVGMIILVQFAQRQASAQTCTTHSIQRPVKMKTASLESPSGVLFLSRSCSLCYTSSKSADKPYEKVSKNRANSGVKRRDLDRFLAMKLDTGNVNTDLTSLTARHSPDATLLKSEHMRAPVLYLFTHSRLGLLGNLIISDAGPRHSQVSFEIAPGADPDSTAWGEQYDLFRQVATLCLNALPGGDGKAALPPVEEARAQRRLYQRFIHCQHSLDMFALAKQLSQPEYEQLLAAIETALITAPSTDRKGIDQRRGELQVYWADLQARPEV